MKETIVIALGGNAILQSGEKGTYEEQINNVEKSASEIIKFIIKGYRIVLTHGNGPQVGNIYIQQNLAGEVVPPMPLDVCAAESQGLIGYFLQQAIRNELKRNKIDIPIVTFITQVLVDMNDKAFKNPTKPIGPFHTKREAELIMKRTSFIMKEDSNHKWRRVVPSPTPISILEKEIIKKNIEEGYLVIAAGGGGIPVIEKNNKIIGIEAVIDKDLTAACLANDINADFLLILTDVEKVSLFYNTPKQKDINIMSINEAKKYLKEGHFKEGSMKPKIEASIKFLEKGGKKSVIGNLFHAYSSFEGKTGTTIVKEYS
jgi:carbamate kinase